MSISREYIDVRDRIAAFSMADCVRTAEGYFQNIDRAAILMKPFSDLGEAPEVLLTLMHVIKGLGLRKGDTVFDFGAGSCWTSRILAAFGFRVIASDISAAALDVGRELFERYPITVDHAPPEFLLFDGRTIDLPTASVDAVCCISALHHVPNPGEVIAEFGRLLKPWKRAGFSEPGPAHSRTPQAQAEMRDFDVIENDVVIEDIWEHAKAAGFTTIEMGIFYPEPFLMSLQGFQGFLGGERPNAFEHNMRNLMAERRLFILEKGDPRYTTSVVAAGLDAKVELSEISVEVGPADPIIIDLRLRNTGTAVWRPSSYPTGPVRCGPCLVPEGGDPVHKDRILLDMPERHGLVPEQEIGTSFAMAAPDRPGRYELRFQMVAEAVAWFGQTAKLDIVVV